MDKPLRPDLLYSERSQTFAAPGGRERFARMVAVGVLQRVRRNPTEYLYCPTTKPTAPPRFSYFRRPVRNVTPERTVTPDQLHEVITGPRFAPQTAHLRSLTNLKERKQFKAEAFDHVTPGGTFSRRHGDALLKPSGLLVLDLDDVPNAPALRDTLCGDDQLPVVLAFVSPSGNGVKLLTATHPACDHLTNFRGLSAYLRKRYGVTVDASGKDISRTCFVPHDPDAWLAPAYRVGGLKTPSPKNQATDEINF